MRPFPSTSGPGVLILPDPSALNPPPDTNPDRSVSSPNPAFEKLSDPLKLKRPSVR